MLTTPLLSHIYVTAIRQKTTGYYSGIRAIIIVKLDIFEIYNFFCIDEAAPVGITCGTINALSHRKNTPSYEVNIQ